MESSHALLSKRRTTKKSNQYSEAQTQEISKSILQRVFDAESSVREGKAFKDISSYLESQMTNRDYKSIKTKLNKTLKPSQKEVNSMMDVDFFREIMILALQGKNTYEAKVTPHGKRSEDQETDDSYHSLGKRSPMWQSPLSPMFYNGTKANVSKFFEPTYNLSQELESTQGDSFPQIDSSIEEHGPDSAPASDFMQKAGISFFNRNCYQLGTITEDLPEIPFIREFSDASSIENSHHDDSDYPPLKFEQDHSLLDEFYPNYSSFIFQ